MIGAMAAPIEPKIKGPRNSRRKTGAALASIVFASLTLVAGKRAYEYAAAPTREKDCDFVFPEPGGPPPTAIAAGAVDQPVALVQRGGTNVLGGYGLFGVILDAEIEVVANEMYRSERASVGYRDFPAHYRQHIDGNRGIGLMYARLSVAPTSYLEEVVVHTYEKMSYDGQLPPLQPEGHTWLSRLVISMKYLKNTLPDTDILQEYFIPRERMPAFVDGLRATVRETRANLLNVTVRIVEKDEITATIDLIDLATGLDGRFYLPYQLTYSPEQLHKAYPEIASFFSTKKKVDPTGLFSNTFYEKYGT